MIAPGFPEYVMPDVLIRHIDPDVLEALKARAARNGRSLQAELKRLLEEAAEAERSDALKALRRVRARFKGREFSDSAALIRKDRQR